MTNQEIAPVTTSILGRAAEKGLLQVNVVNIRDYTLDKHRKTDDTPFGGGAGMVMTPQPAFDALRSLGAHIERIREGESASRPGFLPNI